MTVSVLYPSQQPNPPVGWMIGSYLSTINCFCVVGILDYKKFKSVEHVNKSLNLLSAGFKYATRILGVQILAAEECHVKDYLLQVFPYSCSTPCLILKNVRSVPEVSVIQNDLQTEKAFSFSKPNLFVYEPCQILCSAQFISQSTGLKEQFAKEKLLSQVANSKHSPFPSVKTALITFLYEANKNRETVEDVMGFEFHVEQSYNFIGAFRVLLNLWSMLILTAANLVKFSAVFFIQSMVSVFKKALTISSFGMQVMNKAQLLSKLNTDCSFLIKSDVFFSVILDILLGMAFYTVVVLFDGQLHTYTIDTLRSSAQFIGKEVEQLIQWLMGIPIGLKLNSPLNQFLGKFFLHHVQLWLEYVELTLSSLQSTYSQSIFLQWTLSLSCFGLSLFFGFLSDVVSLLSFHIYCFYVYAARLYRLQLVGILSLWRLFCGKKWNPLRERVDTLSDGSDSENPRFFLGTLLFTILLFLLPTTILYYAIFAALRVAVLAVQNILACLRSVASCFPWCSIIVRKCQPLVFPGRARFRILSNNIFAGTHLPGVTEDQDRGPFTFQVTIEPQSFAAVIRHRLHELGGFSFEQGSLKTFLRSLFSGKLLKWS